MRRGSQASQLTGQQQVVCLRNLKLLLRARKIAHCILTSQVSGPEIEEMLQGFQAAIDVMRALLVRQKGRKRYLREMLGYGPRALQGPGQVEVLFKDGAVKLDWGHDLVEQILMIEKVRNSWALAVCVGGKEFFL